MNPDSSMNPDREMTGGPTPLAGALARTGVRRAWARGALRLSVVVLVSAYAFAVAADLTSGLSHWRLEVSRFRADAVINAMIAKLHWLAPALTLWLTSVLAVGWIVPEERHGCPRCGYAIDGHMFACPECGAQLRKARGVEYGRVYAREAGAARLGDGRASGGPEVGPASPGEGTA